MAKTSAYNAEDGIIIKKYANRRLYNTQTSSYITLDFLSKLTREGQNFKVVDAKTGDDITHNILTQIIMEEEAGGQQLLPVSFLRELISMYGNSVQSMVPQYLEASMQAFRNNQEKFESVVKGSIANSPLVQIHKQNMAILEAASSVFKMPSQSDAAAPEAAPSSAADDIKSLQDQLSAMQQKLDEMDKKS